MKIFLLKDIEKVGIQGEIIKVSDGFAANFIIPKKLGIQITPANEAFYKKKIKTIENRKEAVSTATSMLAEKIKDTTITIKRKMHDEEKFYGSVTTGEIKELLSQKGIAVAKNQILIDKPIRTKGLHEIIVKLSSRLQPSFKLKIVPEN